MTGSSKHSKAPEQQTNHSSDEKCKNCHSNVSGNFCANCGQRTNIQALSLKTLLQELSDNVFQINHGLFFSIVEFSKRPGISVSNYLACKRKRYLQPIAYAFTLASIYFLLSQFIEQSTFFDQITEGFKLASDNSEQDKLALSILNWFSKNYAFTALLIVPLFAGASKLAFINKGRNYLEHLVLNLYITGHQTLFYSFFALVSLLLEFEDLIETLTLITSMCFAGFTFYQFFEVKQVLMTVIKTLVYYACALVMMVVLLMMVMSISLYLHK